jgi:hypothetical protein
LIINLKRRWIPVYLVALTASVAILVALLNLYFATKNEQYLSGALLVSMLSAYVSWSLAKLMRIKPVPRQIITLLKCEACGYEEERGFTNGDSLFQEKGICPKCSIGKMIVAGIFVRQHEEGKKTFKYTLPSHAG